VKPFGEAPGQGALEWGVAPGPRRYGEDLFYVGVLQKVVDVPPPSLLPSQVASHPSLEPSQGRTHVGVKSPPEGPAAEGPHLDLPPLWEVDEEDV